MPLSSSQEAVNKIRSGAIALPISSAGPHGLPAGSPLVQVPETAIPPGKINLTFCDSAGGNITGIEGYPVKGVMAIPI